MLLCKTTHTPTNEQVVKIIANYVHASETVILCVVYIFHIVKHLVIQYNIAQHKHVSRCDILFSKKMLTRLLPFVFSIYVTQCQGKMK
jgi:hypothetical protein